MKVSSVMTEIEMPETVALIVWLRQASIATTIRTEVLLFAFLTMKTAHSGFQMA